MVSAEILLGLGGGNQRFVTHFGEPGYFRFETVVWQGEGSQKVPNFEVTYVVVLG